MDRPVGRGDIYERADDGGVRLGGGVAQWRLHADHVDVAAGGTTPQCC
ncbi:hypothetical protein ACWD8I_19850 [Micromonospora arida]